MNFYTIPFYEIDLGHHEIVGGKNASLGELTQNLASKGLRVPEGYAITINAFKDFVAFNGIQEVINEELAGLDFENITSLQNAGSKIRNAFYRGNMSKSMKNEIKQSYFKLYKDMKDVGLVAIRSSSTAEDLPEASFAGQQDTFLNVSSFEELYSGVVKCFASLYNDRAISYRHSMGFDLKEVNISVGIQKMVRSSFGISGVSFSIDPKTGFENVVVTNATYGIGELLVQGGVNPDEYICFKKNRVVIEKKLGEKRTKMIWDSAIKSNLIDNVSESQRRKFCLTDDIVVKVSDAVIAIEKHYTSLYGKKCPVDVEWAIDGISGELYILQSRPETVHSKSINHSLLEYNIEKGQNEKRVLSGTAIGDGVGSGKVHYLKDIADLNSFDKGDVLVTEMTDPDWEPIMRKASAIVTEKGGRTCHAAIVSREIGVPAIVGAENACEILKELKAISVSCCEGEIGYVYTGVLRTQLTKTEISELDQIQTNLMLNVALPENVFKYSSIPNSGVGLAREEFIINNYIKVHPMALLNHKMIGDTKLSQEIEEIVKGYASEESFFVSKLAQGISKIACTFYDKPVIVRFSDFKSNEYQNLLGGKYFEPCEENPMIGWRGASRYYSARYKKAFELECKAIRKVREEMGFRNVVVMIPFCRTIRDCNSVLEVMREYGLERGKFGLEVYLMAEVPSNFILADKFADLVDGFSIGTNDLTQLTLGLDRDSELVSHLYDERNEAVKELILNLIEVGRKKGVKVGICGQAPSDFPDFTKFLVENNINSISVTPDSIVKTIKAISEVEKSQFLRKVS